MVSCCFYPTMMQGNMARLVSTSLARGLVRSCRATSTGPSSVPSVNLQRFSPSFPIGRNSNGTIKSPNSCQIHWDLTVPRPTFQQLMTYSSASSGDSNVNGGTSTTRVAADPDTHQDLQPTSKGSDMSLHDIVAKDIKENPVLIYMKGYPDAPRCGFSALAVKVLQQYGVPISARDILSNMKLKESVKAHTNWPTFPQIFIKGEFVGGSDIILNMHQKGELKGLLGDINAQKGEQDSAP